MKSRIAVVLALSAFVAVSSSACATKKYARNRINERVTPLEQRAGELEETSRRNSQDISKIGSDITEVRGRTDRAQSQADTALARADEANSRAGSTEQSLGDLRANIDKYSLQNTAAVNFKFDSYQLTPEAQQALDQIAAQIKDRGNFILEIQGFADSTGTTGYNNQLTQKRADAVRRYLAEQHNIPLFRMHILGFGEVRAVADNQTREGRAQNRRVEVRLLTRGLGEGSAAQSTSSTSQN
jgi:OmpA-OmpF porin, OOP family